jgi:hypothetical protein
MVSIRGRRLLKQFGHKNLMSCKDEGCWEEPLVDDFGMGTWDGWKFSKQISHSNLTPFCDDSSLFGAVVSSSDDSAMDFATFAVLKKIIIFRTHCICKKTSCQQQQKG